jgi:hypothetical protein
MEVLSGAGLYVRFGHSDWGDGCTGASLHHSDDCEDLWILSDLADQWWSAEDYAERIGWRFFFWVLTLHTKMMGQLNRCRAADSGEFAFGSILVLWFLERVPMLHPRVFLLTG